MKLVILKTGTYNNQYHKAVRCAEGDILHTTSDYGKSLVDVGFAALPGERQEPGPTEELPVLVEQMVAELGLSSRIVAGLKARGLVTVENVAEVSDGELQTIVGIGKSTANKMREWLEEKDLIRATAELDATLKRLTNEDGSED